MKYVFPIFLILIVISCDKQDDEFVYSYKITKVNRTPSNYIQDSIIYYYDNQDRLLKLAECRSGYSNLDSYPHYNGDRIELNGKQYVLDSNHRVDSLIHDIDAFDCYSYENNYLVHESSTTNNSVVAEHFYTYSEGALLKDSGIYNEQYITVYHHTCTDTLAPHYMIHPTGLKEYPPMSKYLIRESTAPEAGIKDIRSYVIGENELTVFVKTIDTFHNDTVDLPSTKYYYQVR